MTELVVPDSSNSRKSKDKDIGWDYGIPIPGNRDHVQCSFCETVYKGGITRLKYHLIGNNKNVAPCKKCPQHVKERLEENWKQKLDEKQAPRQVNHVDAFIVDDEGVEIISKRDPVQKGPINMYFRQEGGGKKFKSVKEQNEHDKCRKEMRDYAVHMFSRWMYDAGISFNAVTYESFGAAIEAIGQYGPGMKPPTYHEVRTKFLNKEKECIEKEVEEHMNEGKKNGCTLMADGWTDRNGRTLINFLVNTPKGSIFLDSVDASSYSKTGEKMCELLSDYISQIGPENVVQVVTDNASENVLAGKLLEAKFPHLFWTPCAAHCLDLMFEDIFKLKRFKRTIERAIKVSGYIYNRSKLLSMMRKFTGGKELVRPAKTRFATGFLTLKRFHEEKKNLRSLINSDEWLESKFSKEMAGRNVKNIISMQSFWKNTYDLLRVGGPLLTVLRMVDGEQKPAMGYIYEAMDKAKETIEKAFSYNQEKYKDIFDLIDKRWNNQLHRPLHAAGNYLNPSLFYANENIHLDVEIMRGFQICLEKMIPNAEKQDKITEELNAYKNAEGSFGSKIAIRQRVSRPPVEWWSNYGSSSPNLAKFAMRILGLVCSSSGCERNWSFFEHIHSKKRNRLAQERLKKLVYIKYNRALNRRYEARDKIDIILMNDIDDSNEWMTGEPDMIDTNVIAADNEGDEDDELLNFNVGRDDSSELDYNLRSSNASAASSARAKKRKLVDEDSEDEDIPFWSVNQQSVPDDELVDNDGSDY